MSSWLSGGRLLLSPSSSSSPYIIESGRRALQFAHLLPRFGSQRFRSACWKWLLLKVVSYLVPLVLSRSIKSGRRALQFAHLHPRFESQRFRRACWQWLLLKACSSRCSWKG